MKSRSSRTGHATGPPPTSSSVGPLQKTRPMTDAAWSADLSPLASRVDARRQDRLNRVRQLLHDRAGLDEGRQQLFEEERIPLRPLDQCPPASRPRARRGRARRASRRPRPARGHPARRARRCGGRLPTNDGGRAAQDGRCRSRAMGRAPRGRPARAGRAADPRPSAGPPRAGPSAFPPPTRSGTRPRPPGSGRALQAGARRR